MGSNDKSVLKGLKSQTIVTILIGIVDIVSFSIMSRILTQIDFGYFASMMAITTVFYSLADTGIGAALVQRKELNNAFIDNAFTLSFIIGVSLTTILYLSSGWLSGLIADATMKKPLQILSITLLLYCISSVDLSLLQRDMKFYHIGCVRLLSSVITTIVAVSLALLDWGYYAILTKSVLDSVITTFVALFLTKRKCVFSLNKSICCQIINFSGWLMLSAFFRNISYQIDRLLMPRLFSIHALGMYSRPKDFINTIANQSGRIFDMVLFPVLSDIQAEKNELKESYKTSLYFINLFTIVIATALAFNSELLIRVFFGEKWLNINNLVIILSFSFVFVMNGKISDVFLRAIGKTKLQFYFRVLQSILSTILIMVGSVFSVEALALGFVLSLWIVVFAKLVYLSAYIQYSLKESIIISVTSFRLLLVILPLYLVLTMFLSHTLIGNFIKLFVYIVVVVGIFVGFPKFIGEYYSLRVHKVLMDKINNIKNSNVKIRKRK